MAESILFMIETWYNFKDFYRNPI